MRRRHLLSPGGGIIPCIVLLAMLAPVFPPAPAFAQETSRIDELIAIVQPIVERAADAGVRVSVGLVDVSGEDGAAAVVGSADPYNPASTIKMALLAAVMRQADRGLLSLEAPITVSPYMVVGGAGTLQRETLPYTTTVAELARLMVVVSDNTATNILLYYIGIPTVQELMDDLGLRTMRFNRQMFPGDRISDPQNVIDARDTIELLRAIYDGDFLSEASRARILEWMLAQEVHTKFGAFAVTLPDSIREGFPIAHKTGETGNVTHDVGYFLVPGAETIVSVFAEVTTTSEFSEAARIGNPIVQEIARAVHEYLVSSGGR